MTEATPMSVLASLHQMSDDEFDGLPFGAIQFDDAGTIISYNSRESEISGRESADVMGKNFFTEVAPCTNVQAFAGRFREGVITRNLNAVFPYRFDFPMAPRDVSITLFYSEKTGTAWVFVVDA